jgi:hypothetical protein
VGVLYSKNAALNAALGNLGYFASVPAPLQMTLSKLLSDDAWLDGCLRENRRRMLEAYTQLTGRLTVGPWAGEGLFRPMLWSIHPAKDAEQAAVCWAAA